MAYLDANHDGAVAFPEVARACKSRIIADVLDPNDDNAYDEAEVLDKVRPGAWGLGLGPGAWGLAWR
eukprot:tig00020734_g13594.t1